MRWDISRQTVERILQLPKRKRDKLFTLFDQLAANLEDLSDGSFTTSEGAAVYFATLDHHVVTYAIDHPVKLVHILAVE